jgi:hypothetical protein
LQQPSILLDALVVLVVVSIGCCSSPSCTMLSYPALQQLGMDPGIAAVPSDPTSTAAWSVADFIIRRLLQSSPRTPAPWWPPPNPLARLFSCTSNCSSCTVRFSSFT